MSVMTFIDRYFVEPVMSSQGYNVYNTLVYGVFFLISIYLVNGLLKHLKIKFNEDLFWSLVPFVVLGGIVRALGQLTYVKGEGLLPPSFWFFTPGIYILIASLTLISLLISIWIRGDKYKGMMMWFGGVPGSIGLLYIFTQAVNPIDFVKIIFLSCLVGIGLYLIIKGFNAALLSNANLLIIGGFVLDSTTTSYATAYLGYMPEHVLTGLISSSNPFFFIIFKLVLIIGVLIFIEKDSEEKEKWLFKLAMLILGLPHGIHDSLQVLMGV